MLIASLHPLPLFSPRLTQRATPKGFLDGGPARNAVETLTHAHWEHASAAFKTAASGDLDVALSLSPPLHSERSRPPSVRPHNAPKRLCNAWAPPILGCEPSPSFVFGSAYSFGVAAILVNAVVADMLALTSFPLVVHCFWMPTF